MKLATEQHAEIANTFMPPIITCLKVLDVLCNENVTADVPNDIVDDIEKVRDALGATPLAPRVILTLPFLAGAKRPCE
jgi:hypothetical protein